MPPCRPLVAVVVSAAPPAALLALFSSPLNPILQQFATKAQRHEGRMEQNRWNGAATAVQVPNSDRPLCLCGFVVKTPNGLCSKLTDLQTEIQKDFNHEFHRPQQILSSDFTDRIRMPGTRLQGSMYLSGINPCNPWLKTPNGSPG